MTQAYFRRFPNLYYDGSLCKDITRRVNITEGDVSSPFLFYPYEMKDEMRADHIAEYYYKDAYADWLILLSNQIVDPYYGWYNDAATFMTLLREKYGSFENAQKLIAFYRNNWASDTQTLTVSFYNNTLPKSHRKYYEPIFATTTKIVGYKRKEDYTTTNTNRILQYTVYANNSTFGLQNGELVDIKPTGLDGTVATGQVETSNSSMVRIKNVSGNTHANTSYVIDIVGETTGANVSANSVTILFENFSNTEAVFWESVSYYDLEVENNEEKKNLKIIGDGVYQLFIDEFTRKVRQDVDETTGLSEN